MVELYKSSVERNDQENNVLSQIVNLTIKQSSHVLHLNIQFMNQPIIESNVM